MEQGPVRIASVGLSGYAGQAARSLLTQSSRPDPVVQLASVFVPDPANNVAQIDELRARGVPIVDSYGALLGSEAEAVWLPLPIHLHRDFTEAALAAGKVVLVEKPAAGSIDDVDAMITARDRCGLPVAVGFQDIYGSGTAALKQAVLAGEIGSVRSITVTGCWPRSAAYYGRNQWAGRQQFGGKWVLDSPANNALAHFVNLGLFLAGDSLNRSTEPHSIEAELYRVNPIENYDTCAFRLRLSHGVNILVYLTHASMKTVHPTIRIRGTDGQVEWRAFSEIKVQPSGRSVPLQSHDGVIGSMITRFAGIVRGDMDPSKPFATLEQARAHAITINGASQACAIASVDSAYIETRTGSENAIHRYIPNIESLFEMCSRHEILPYESGLAEWTQPAGQLDLRHYCHFEGPVGLQTPRQRESESDLAPV